MIEAFLMLFSLPVVFMGSTGAYIGPLRDTVQGVTGDLYAVDKTTVYVANFSQPSTGTYIYAGTLNPDGSYTKTGYPLHNSDGQAEAISAADTDFILHFPEGSSIYSVDWIGVLARKKKKMIGRVLVSDSVKLSIPRSEPLGPLKSSGSVSSSEVVLLDSGSILIKDFSFSPNKSPDTYFMVGTGSKPSPYGIKIPDEEGSLAPLKTYRHKSVLLTLPPTIDVSAIDWFSVWSQSLQMSLGEIEIPRVVNVPPSQQKLGLNSQDDLNCELLSRDLGLQLRWSIVGTNIILQIVGDIGSEMYMAFGVKSDSASGQKTKGDVVVGWINSVSGKGGVDDYFLSGEEVCEDGAESCPDSSKQGGGKSIELLNSVSRNNYTMITFKRSLFAADPYDIDVLTDRDQEVFWSVGYKKADLRVKNKPLKNKDPLSVEFGRPTLWNCPREKSLNKITEKKVRGKTVKKDSAILLAKGSSQIDNSIRRIDVGFDEDAYPDYNYDYTDEDPYLTQKKPSYPYRPQKTPSYPSLAQRTPSLSTPQPNLRTSQFRPAPSVVTPQSPAPIHLEKKFPKRRDGQKTTLELIPELGNFVKPFFPKGPPPGARPPPRAAPPGPATHAPPPADQNWQVPSIGCNTSENTVFYLQIGPAAGKKGNQGLGEHGSAWYVNGDLAPDLYLLKGTEYTFIVEGGLGTDSSGTIHPFYLTSDSEGGYATKSDYEARMEDVYGGTKHDRDGLPVPSVMGRLCLWRSRRAPPTFATYEDFKSDLNLECQDTGQPGILRFTADYDSTNLIYYQSFTEKFMGGKIHLMDQCHEIFKAGHNLQSSLLDKSNSNSNSNSNNNNSNIKRNRNIIDKPSSNSKKYESNKTKVYQKPVKKTSYKKYTTTERSTRIYTNPPSYRKRTTPVVLKPSKYNRPTTKPKKGGKKCSSGHAAGMPQFEHFPVADIMKEGVDSDCDDKFAWKENSAVTDETDEYTDDYVHDDYVQPTTKPLVFTQTMKKPDRKSDLRPFDRFDSEVQSGFGGGFPNLFSNMPKFGGFDTTTEKRFVVSTRLPDIYKSANVKEAPSTYQSQRPTKVAEPSRRTPVTNAPQSYQKTTQSQYQKPTKPSFNYGKPTKTYQKLNKSSYEKSTKTPFVNSKNRPYAFEKPTKIPYEYENPTNNKNSYGKPSKRLPYYDKPGKSLYESSTTSSYSYPDTTLGYDYPASTLGYDYSYHDRHDIYETTTARLRPSDYFNRQPVRAEPLPPPSDFPDFFQSSVRKSAVESIGQNPKQGQIIFRPKEELFNSGRRPELASSRAPNQPSGRIPHQPYSGPGIPKFQFPKPSKNVARYPGGQPNYPAPLPPPRNFPNFDSKQNGLAGISQRIRKSEGKLKIPLRPSGEHGGPMRPGDQGGPMTPREHGGPMRPGDHGGPMRPGAHGSPMRPGGPVRPNGRIRKGQRRNQFRRSGHDRNQGQMFRPNKNRRVYHSEQRDQSYSPSQHHSTVSTKDEPSANLKKLLGNPSPTRPTSLQDILLNPATNKNSIQSLLPKKITNKDPSSLGIGVFNSGGLISESGFRPILPNHSSAPSLAFSIFDSEETGGMAGSNKGNNIMERMDIGQDVEGEVGDRGHVVVDIPAPVLPYVPNSYMLNNNKDSVYPDYEYAGSDYDYLYADYPPMYSDYTELRPVYSNMAESRAAVDTMVAIQSADPSVEESADFKMADAYSGGTQQAYTPNKSLQRSLMIDTPLNRIISIDDIKTEKGEKNSLDFHEFETVYNPAAEIKVGKVHDVIIPHDQLKSNDPLLLSVGSSFSYGGGRGGEGGDGGDGGDGGGGGRGEGKQGPNSQSLTGAVGSVSSPHYINKTGGSSPTVQQDVVYGKLDESPAGPLSALDERMRSKLEQLHQAGQTPTRLVADLVEDLWTKQ